MLAQFLDQDVVKYQKNFRDLVQSIVSTFEIQDESRRSADSAWLVKNGLARISIRLSQNGTTDFYIMGSLPDSKYEQEYFDRAVAKLAPKLKCNWEISKGEYNVATYSITYKEMNQDFLKDLVIIAQAMDYRARVRGSSTYF